MRSHIHASDWPWRRACSCPLSVCAWRKRLTLAQKVSATAAAATSLNQGVVVAATSAACSFLVKKGSGATDANGGTVTIVGPATVAQSVQTQHLFDMTLDGNTAGALGDAAGGTSMVVGHVVPILGTGTNQTADKGLMVECTGTGVSA